MPTHNTTQRLTLTSKERVFIYKGKAFWRETWADHRGELALVRWYARKLEMHATAEASTEQVIKSEQ